MALPVHLNKVAVVFEPDSNRVSSINLYECVPDPNDPTSIIHHLRGTLNAESYMSADGSNTTRLSGFYNPLGADFVELVTKCVEKIDNPVTVNFDYTYRFEDESLSDNFSNSDINVLDILGDVDNKGKIYGHMLANDPIYREILRQKAVADHQAALADKVAAEKADHSDIYYKYHASGTEITAPAAMSAATYPDIQAIVEDDATGPGLFKSDLDAFIDYEDNIGGAGEAVLQRYVVRFSYQEHLPGTTNADPEPYKATVLLMPQLLQNLPEFEVCIPVSPKM